MVTSEPSLTAININIVEFASKITSPSEIMLNFLPKILTPRLPRLL